MEPLLSICCTTYNQENYIAQTLEGFLMQKTTFPIEIIVHDDASTDKTVEIIKAYAEKDDRFVTILQTENQYSKNVKPWANFVFPKARGKYIALCEGDDYWTDPLKLQKQVDFLEANPNYAVSWTNYKIYKENDFLTNNFNHAEELTTIDFKNIFSPYCTYTLTTVFKRDALDLKLLRSLKHNKDNSLYIILLTSGLGIFMDFESAVYRVNEGGVYSMQSTFFKHYSSFINLKEITDLIPEAKTKNIQKVMNSLEKATAYEVLKLKKSGETPSEQQYEFLSHYYEHANFIAKLKYYKRILKHTLKRGI